MTDLLADLSETLRGRVRTLNDRPVRDEGVILCWLHNALRVDDNPALNVAIELSNATGRPLLIYQGLSQGYPFASDRHHTFILQAAVDLAGQCRAAGLPYALHVERPGHDGPVLRNLVDAAAAVVTDDMPTEPARQWAEGLSRRGAATWAVDAACVVPLTATDRAYERAFEFRSATKAERDANVGRSFPRPDLEAACNLAAVCRDAGFEPVDTQRIDISRLVGECEIDHGVGPVSHTRGGTAAARERWRSWRNAHLDEYRRERNDALKDGTSRMSPYLHYGMISVFELTRDLAGGGEGPQKYLDELLVWRELAYHFCHHTPHYATLAAIPAWAEATLSDHADDERPAIHDWETMARGRTGDPLWDAAQASLLIHGELHNNVRMTWGKAILNWTAGPEECLTRLIDLNNRYALDGRDPSSYGGLLWCLGQFDRPFKPEQPVTGTVRGRDTKTHARRLDPKQYGQRTRRPLVEPVPSVAVIGGGLSGLMTARTLADHGLNVTVLDRGRRVGGRASTKTLDSGRFDHGTPWLVFEDERLAPYAHAWTQQGLLRPWSLDRAQYDEDSPGGRVVATWEVLVPVPGVSAVCEHLAADLAVEHSTKVEDVCVTAGGVTLTIDGEERRFDAAAIAMPPEQAARLVDDFELPADSKPQHVAMATFDGGLRTAGDWIDFGGHTLVSAIHESAKPGRKAAERWVITSDSHWSATRLDDDPDAIAKLLVEEFLATVQPGGGVSPTHVSGHRWTFARADVEDHAGRRRGQQTDPPDRGPLVFAGDWQYGNKAEAALLSGLSAAGRVLRRLMSE